MTAKNPGKAAAVIVTNGFRDLCDGFIGMLEQAFGVFNSDPADKVG